MSEGLFAQQIRAHFDSSDNEVSDVEILEAISNMFTPIEEMHGVLQSVRDTGRRVGLLSNTCVSHWNWIQRQRFSVMDFNFDSTILSFEVGSMKPQRTIYEAAEEAAGVPVNEILFLDDRHENIDAAESFGWRAHQCFGGKEAIDVLNNYRLLEPTR